jgi:hypothetical protein
MPPRGHRQGEAKDFGAGSRNMAIQTTRGFFVHTGFLQAKGTGTA